MPYKAQKPGNYWANWVRWSEGFFKFKDWAAEDVAEGYELFTKAHKHTEDAGDLCAIWPELFLWNEFLSPRENRTQKEHITVDS